jgi:hypothetical protein
MEDRPHDIYFAILQDREDRFTPRSGGSLIYPVDNKDA